jgi:hypothetical protein
MLLKNIKVFSLNLDIFFMKSCFESLEIHCDFSKMVETQFKKCIKIFRSNNAGEYKQHDFLIFLKQYAPISQSSYSKTFVAEWSSQI